VLRWCPLSVARPKSSLYPTHCEGSWYNDFVGFRLVVLLNEDDGKNVNKFLTGDILAHAGKGKKSKQPSDPSIYIHLNTLLAGRAYKGGTADLQHLLQHEAADLDRGFHAWQPGDEEQSVERLWNVRYFWAKPIEISAFSNGTRDLFEHNGVNEWGDLARLNLREAQQQGYQYLKKNKSLKNEKMFVFGQGLQYLINGQSVILESDFLITLGIPINQHSLIPKEEYWGISLREISRTLKSKFSKKWSQPLADEIEAVLKPHGRGFKPVIQELPRLENNSIETKVPGDPHEEMLSTLSRLSKEGNAVGLHKLVNEKTDLEAIFLSRSPEEIASRLGSENPSALSATLGDLEKGRNLYQAFRTLQIIMQTSDRQQAFENFQTVILLNEEVSPSPNPFQKGSLAIYRSPDEKNLYLPINLINAARNVPKGIDALAAVLDQLTRPKPVVKISDSLMAAFQTWDQSIQDASHLTQRQKNSLADHGFKKMGEVAQLNFKGLLVKLGKNSKVSTVENLRKSLDLHGLTLGLTFLVRGQTLTTVEDPITVFSLTNPFFLNKARDADASNLHIGDFTSKSKDGKRPEWIDPRSEMPPSRSRRF